MMRLWIVRPKRDRLLIMLVCLIHRALTLKGNCQVVVRLWVIGLELEGFAVVGDRVF